MQSNFINTLSEAKKLVEDVGYGNISIMYDMFQMNIEEKNIYKSIEQYKNIYHVHFADSNRRAPGEGGMNYEKITKNY